MKRKKRMLITLILTAILTIIMVACSVNANASLFSLNKKKVTLKIGETFQLKVNATEPGDTVKKFPATPFLVRVLINNLNYRSEPSMNGRVNGQTGVGTFTITEVKDGWGRLKSGAGWIWLENPSYCTVGNSVASPAKPANKSVDEIAKAIGVDSLAYLSVDATYKLAENASVGFCNGCFTGNYPIAVPKVKFKDKFEQKMNRMSVLD